MAYRLPYLPNHPLPLALTLDKPGPGHFTPLPAHGVSPFSDSAAPSWPPAFMIPPSREKEPVGLTTEQLHVLAMDLIPFDTETDDNATDERDHLWFHTRLIDPLHQSVHIRGRECLPRRDGFQFFGGVMTNQMMPATADYAPHTSWLFFPMKAWGAFDITVNEDVWDEDVFGFVELLHTPRLFRLTLYPWHVAPSGQLIPQPVAWAESLGVGGLAIEWHDTAYRQAPAVTVRAEKGDTLESIAQEMAVDRDVVIRANVDVAAPDQPLRGESIRVPLVAAPRQRRRHPSTSLSLTWKEMIHGWTTLN